MVLTKGPEAPLSGKRAKFLHLWGRWRVPPQEVATEDTEPIADSASGKFPAWRSRPRIAGDRALALHIRAESRPESESQDRHEAGAPPPYTRARLPFRFRGLCHPKRAEFLQPLPSHGLTRAREALPDAADSHRRRFRMASNAPLDQVTRWGKIPAWWLLHPAVDADRLAVMAALCTYADEAGFCEPSQATLARRLGRSRPWVNRVIAELAAAGLIRKQARARQNGGTTSCRYHLAQTPEQARSFVQDTQLPVMGETGLRPAGDRPCHPADTSHATPEQIQDTHAVPAQRRDQTPPKERDEPTQPPRPGASLAEPAQDWSPSREIAERARQLYPDAPLEHHTLRFVTRCRAKGYRYANLDAAWLEWLIADRTQPRRPQATGLEGAGRQAVSAARQPAEHRLHRFDAWAAAAMSPPSHVSPY